MLHHTDDPSGLQETHTPMEDDSHMLNIPPRIAARFYRTKKPSTPRRRSSSSSSANTFVHPSDRAFNRRVTFLETRKSRLAARAVYADKVRSRVNHDSHEVLSARLQALRDSLTAAQETRNALLAKTAAACAMEVAKAKQVAEEVRLKREGEIQSIRDGMEDRLKMAEERRMELLRTRRHRRSRGSSASKSAGELESVAQLRKVAKDDAAKAATVKSDEEIKQAAARKIQRLWRVKRNKVVVQSFAGLGLTLDSIKSLTFESASALVMNPSLLGATSQLLKLCNLISGTEGVLAINKSCRTFLSAYLILGHPAEVLSNDGEHEKVSHSHQTFNALTDAGMLTNMSKTLITQSKDLLCAFESWISTADAHNSYLGAAYLRQKLVDAYEPFFAAFTSWKERDQAELIDGMIAQFVELDQLWQKVKDDAYPQVTREYHEGIKENQMIVLSRLKTLGGPPAMASLKKAIGRARRSLVKRREDARPRAAVDASPSKAPVDASAMDILSAGAAAGQVPETEDDPDYLAEVDDASKYTLSNRQLAHELLLDRDFKLKPREKSPIEQMVEAQAKRAFYDIMREDIAAGESEKWIPSMAETIRQKLLRLLRPGSPMHTRISSVIDIEIIAQECRAGTYDHIPFFTFVYQLLPSLCSPARDEAVKSLTSAAAGEEDYITRLEKLFDVLELMQLDNANYTLMASAHLILPEALGYEQRMFAADLASGKHTLANTTFWLQSAITTRPDLRHADKFAEAYTDAFVNLMISLDPYNPATIPETFQLDHERIWRSRVDVRNIVLSSAMLLTIKSLLRRDVARTSWKPIKDAIIPLLNSPTSTPAASAEAITALISSHLTTLPPTPAQLSSIRSVLTHLFAPELPTGDAVVKIVLARLKAFVSARLGAKSTRDRIRLTTTGAETLASSGMAECGEEVVGCVERWVGMWRVNAFCYGRWYGDIWGDLVPAAADEGPVQ